MMQLSVNARVELASLGCRGTVEHVGDGYVRVRWDDGKVGLLYSEGCVANANHLIGFADNADAKH